MGTLGGFLAEARRRRVFRTAGLYIVGAWILLQVADLALESLQLPGGMLRYVWLIAFIGFPFALVFGWYYDVTVAGIRKTPPATDADTVDHSLGVPDYAIIVALAIVAGAVSGGILDRMRQDESLTAGPSGIAVLPLANLSGDDGQAYFSAGMHDALIASLSKIRALRVVSRTSTLGLTSELTAPEIGAKLGVTHVVEGSVAREGNRVRIIVQLIETASDSHIWAESFDRELGSVLTLQNEMAKSIARAIDVQLRDSEEIALSREQSVDPDIYDQYLRGMHLLNQVDIPTRKRGIAILEQVVAEDPGSALAWASLAYGYALLGHSAYPEGMYPSSRLASRRALELDDTLAEAHLSVGMLKLYYEWDFAAAKDAFERAIELNPNLAAAYYHYGWLQEIYRRSDLAIPLGEKAAELDPLSVPLQRFLGSQYRAAGEFEKAQRAVEVTLQLDPQDSSALRLRAGILAGQGRFDEAVEMTSSDRDDPQWRFFHGVMLARAGRLEEARAILDKIDKTPRNTTPILRLSQTIGDAEMFFEWLARARDMRLPFYPWFITWFHMHEQIWQDPRLEKFAAEIGLDDVVRENPPPYY